MDNVLYVTENDQGYTYRITDSGSISTWTPVYQNNNAVLSSIENTLYIGINGGGVYKTNDKGESWTQINMGLGSPYIQSLYSIGNVLYSGPYWSIYKTEKTETGEEKNWEPVNNTPPSPTIWTLYSMDDALYLGGPLSGGVYKSIDRGANWKQINKGLTDINLRTPVAYILHSTNNSLYVGTGNGVYKTIDGGNNWTSFKEGLEEYTYVYTTLSANNVLYIGTGGYGVYKRTIDGVSWEAFSEGLGSGLNVRTLCVLDGVLYAGTKGGEGVYKIDIGKETTWTPIGPAPSVLSVRSLYAMGNALYAGTDQGVYKTTNQGSNWSLINSGLGGNTNIYTLYSNDDNTLYAGTCGGGVYKTNNGGTSWTQVNATGLGDMCVGSVRIVNGALYVGGVGGSGGLYKSIIGTS